MIFMKERVNLLSGHDFVPCASKGGFCNKYQNLESWPKYTCSDTLNVI